MKPPVVQILVSVPDPARVDACTLCFDTLRVGFPRASIHVSINHNTHPDALPIIFDRARKATSFIYHLNKTVHHAEWIRRTVFLATTMGQPLVICDADTIFWKSCEDWHFTPNTLLAGYYVPRIWNDFAKCVSYPRIHTSMMVMPDPAALWQTIKEIYPYSHEKCGEYCPCSPFMPTVQYVDQVPYFWDSCANLFQMLMSERAPKRATHAFDRAQLECYDHLNSASFYDVMAERLPDNRGFVLAHNEWVKDPTKLKNLWPIVDSYYNEKSMEAHVYEH
jgi:hypothetical protein